MLIFFVPFLFEAEVILRLWLKKYPDYAPLFLRLTLVSTLVGLLGDLLFTNILAIGKLKLYMIWETIITGLVFPATYLFFYIGYSPAFPYVFYASAYMILIIVRLFFLKREEQFPVKKFWLNVLKPVLLVTVLACVVPYIFKFLIFKSDDILYSIADIFICGISVLVSIYFAGTNTEEKIFIKNKLQLVYNHLICRR